MKRKFKSFVNLDSVTMICPCGEEITGEGVRIGDFMRRHKDHTDEADVDETINADGARCLVETGS